MTGTRKWGGREAVRLTKLTLSEYGTTCHICGNDGANSADHLVPRSLGGSDAIENLRPAHTRCNSARGNRIGRRARSGQDLRGFFLIPETLPADVQTSGQPASEETP